MYRIGVAMMLCAVVLAGCTDDGGDGTVSDGPTSAECLEQGLILNESAEGGPACEEPPFVIKDFEDPDHFCVQEERRDRVHAPDLSGNPWILGQWWRYNLALDGEDLGDTQMIYYDDQDFNDDLPAHYMVGTPTREEALRHAIESNNPMIGRVHRVLYSPHESGDHADMFHFPLCEGSSWDTVFYDETFELTATRAPVDVPGMGSDPDAFVINGTSASGSTLELSYSPAAQWFTYIDLDRSTGETVDMQLMEVGQGYTGPAFFLRGQQDMEVSLNGSTAAPVVSGGQVEETFMREDGDAGSYDTLGIAIEAGIYAGSGQMTLEILDPDGESAWNGTYQTMGPEASSDMIIEVPYAAGEWTVRMTGAAVGEATDVRADLLVVSIYDRSGEV